MRRLSRKVTDLTEPLRRLLPKGRLVRGIAVLAGGAAIAQALRIAGAPVLTRIFRPEDYGVLAVYSSVISILAPISSLRYELAIPLPEEDDSAAQLLILSLVIALAFAFAVGGLGALWGNEIALSLGAPSLGPYIWLLPVSLAGASAYSALNYWAIRKRSFSSIARTRLGQSISQLITQIGLGLAIVGPVGLLIGDAIGRVAGTGTLATLAARNKATFKEASWSGLLGAARRYARFPLLSAPSALANAAGLNVPALLLATFYGAEIVGWFALAQRIIGIPSTLVGQAVSQVYLSEAAPLARDNPEALRRLFWKMTGKLFLFGIIPTALLCAAGPWLFAGIFGSAWRTTGQYVRLLGPMFLVQFTVVPVSMTANVLERQDLQLGWDIGRFTIVVGSMALANLFGASAFTVVLVYSATMLVAYLTLLGLLSRVLHHWIAKHRSGALPSGHELAVGPASELLAEQ